jgi:hypothetical protein
MARFEIGTRVCLIGGLADHYGRLTGLVTGVREHVSGLSHLNKYRVAFFQGADEWFYEFQLGNSGENPAEAEYRDAS